MAAPLRDVPAMRDDRVAWLGHTVLGMSRSKRRLAAIRLDFGRLVSDAAEDRQREPLQITRRERAFGDVDDVNLIDVNVGVLACCGRRRVDPYPGRRPDPLAFQMLERLDA